jgi:hypothetical protein
LPILDFQVLLNLKNRNHNQLLLLGQVSNFV